jgi:hypothetical protein
MARSITGIDVYDASGAGTYTCDVSFEAGEENEKNVVYFVWSGSGDCGDQLTAWPNVVRVGIVDHSDTSASFAIPDSAGESIASAPDAFAARAFLASSNADYDYLVVGTKSTTGAKTTSNAAFITTGVIPKGKTFAISVDCALSSLNHAYQLFGGNGSTAYMCVGAYIPSNKQWAFYCANNSSSTALDTGLKISTERVNVSLNAMGDYPKGTVTVASSGVQYTVESTTATSTKNGLGLTLFARSTNAGGTTCDRSCAATIYGCIITNNNVQVRDYRPAVKNDIAGMWDAENNKFYSSAGGVGLTAVGGRVWTDHVEPGETQVAASESWTPAAFSKYIWTGSSGDGLLSTDANWKDGVAPDLTGGGSLLVFGEGTASATVSGEITVYGISFATNSNFSLEAADSNAKIKLGRGGISAENTAATGDVGFNLRVPVVFADAPQVWSVAERTVLNLYEPISTIGFEQEDFTIASPGRVNFHADNPDMTCPLVMNDTTPEYRPQIFAVHTGLGPASRPTTINGSIPRFINDGHPVTNTAPLRITKGGSDDNLYFEYSAWQTVYFLGEVRFLNASGGTEFRNKAEVKYYGGLSSASGSLYARFGKDTHFIDEPISISGTLLVDGAPEISLYVQNSWGVYNPYKATTRCMAKYVMAEDGIYKPGNAGSYYTAATATLDLNGYDQRIQRLQQGWGSSGTQLANGYTTVKSAKPAMLEIASSSSDTLAAVFTGAAALGKTVEESAKLAALFVEQVILSTPAPTPFGVSFEKALPWLWQQLNG